VQAVVTVFCDFCLLSDVAKYILQFNRIWTI